jgi:hypothetical protein
MELPGVAAVRWRRGNGAALIRAGEGADQRAADGFPPLPLLCREGSPSRRAVDGRADDLALQACLWELPQGKPSIADQRFVSLSLLVGPLEEADLSVGFARLSRLTPDEQAGHCQPRRPDRPNARHDAQRDGR